MALEDRVLTPAGGIIQGLLPTTAVDSFIPQPILGDLDGDDIVGAADLLILLANWGPCADCSNCPADLDDDCTVGVSDLLLLLANWG